MGRERDTCDTCGARLQQIRLERISGASGDTRVELAHFPVRGCAEGHERREAYPGFNPAILEEIFDGEQLPFAESRGWLRKSRHCSRCSTSLDDVEPEPADVECEVRTERASFQLRVSRPMYTCPDCGLTQMEASRRAAQEEIVDALVDAFQGASIERA